jgi:hypothetical protein
MPAENTIPDYLSVRATTLEEAWSRFDPDLPLPDGSPFYVAREDNPLESIILTLYLARSDSSKYFFAGHRGCGKSTELNRLVADPRIQQKYWPIKFSLLDILDVNDLDIAEVMLAIGIQMIDQYTAGGGRLDDDFLRELETWKGRTVERLQQKGATLESGAGLDTIKFLGRSIFCRISSCISRGDAIKSAKKAPAL